MVLGILVFIAFVRPCAVSSELELGTI